MYVASTEEENPSMVDLEVELSPNALTVLEKRYLKKDKNGQVIETPEEMFWRVAWEAECFCVTPMQER